MSDLMKELGVSAEDGEQAVKKALAERILSSPKYQLLYLLKEISSGCSMRSKKTIIKEMETIIKSMPYEDFILKDLKVETPVEEKEILAEIPVEVQKAEGV